MITGTCQSRESAEESRRLNILPTPTMSCQRLQASLFAAGRLGRLTQQNECTIYLLGQTTQPTI
jgi:hypothetical protein